MKEEKFKIDANKMGYTQCLNWIEEIYRNTPLGTTEDVAFKEVINKLRMLGNECSDKVNKQQKVIDFALEGTKLSGKDKGELIKLLLN